MRIPIETFRLPNGLFVTLSEDHTAPIVAVNLWYHVGSANERPGRTGFAHLFEHMLFQGSANVAANEHFELVQRAGGTLNGSTWLERTNYFETVPSNQLELALWLEANRMGKLLPAMTQQKLDTQRDVVKNERRWSMDNQPYGTWWEKLPALAFPAGASVPSFADRLDGGPDRGEPRRRRAVLRDVLHARQRGAVDRRRLRPEPTRAVWSKQHFGPHSARREPTAAARHDAAADVRPVAARSRARRGHAAAALPRVSIAGVRQRRVLRRRACVARSSACGAEAGCIALWCAIVRLPCMLPRSNFYYN